MPRPRKALICSSQTPFYHCVSRCVRRAFLCGKDHYSGRCYEHRRKWVENRLLFLARIFAIDLCAYAIMSNHTHLVLRINTAKAQALSHDQVLRRWHRLHQGTLLTRRYQNDRAALSAEEKSTVLATIDVYRERLQSISWFMRELNETIARQANQEDECTGRFWEGRFKSQALLDEASVLACMVYVELNPVRTAQVSSTKDLRFTSLNHRLKARKARTNTVLIKLRSGRISREGELWFSFRDYFDLIQWSLQYSSRSQKDPPKIAALSILNQMNVSATSWYTVCSSLEQRCRGEVHLNKWASEALYAV
nr:transposase [Alteromonas lipotrueiana]